MTESIPAVGEMAWHSPSQTLFLVGGRTKGEQGVKLWLTEGGAEGNYFPASECRKAQPEQLRKLKQFRYCEREGEVQVVRQEDRLLLSAGGRHQAIQLPILEPDPLEIATQRLATFFSGAIADLDTWTDDSDG